MHENVLRFFDFVQAKYPRFFSEDTVSVVEFGAQDVNGTVRQRFAAARYVGVDVAVCDSVTVTCLAHEYMHSGDIPDVVVSTEMLEHDPFWIMSLQKMVSLLKPGGLLLVTAAGPGRPEHGTSVAYPESSPVTVAANGWSRYYRNLSSAEIEFAIRPSEVFDEFVMMVGGADIQFCGIKKSGVVSDADQVSS